MQDNYQDVVFGQEIAFYFKANCIELKFDAPQKDPVNGWIISPHWEPCKVYNK